MITNAAVLAALTVFLLVAWLAGELTYLAPYQRLIFWRHGWVIAGAVVVTFLNVFALYYAVARWLFLRDAGRKLTHVDRQLGTREGVHDELRRFLRPKGQ